MKRLSSRWIKVYQSYQRFGLLIFGLFATVLAVSALTSISLEYRVVALGMMVVVTTIGYAIYKVTLEGLVDELWQDGDTLIARRGNREIAFSLQEIARVHARSPRRVYAIELKSTSDGRKVISFLPSPSVSGEVLRLIEMG